MKLSRVGVDLAKSVYQLHGVDRHGKTVWKRRLRRGQWLQALLDKAAPGGEIGMEACTGAHHWARELQARGYTVRLIAPQLVKPFVKSNKNDANDAEAICEAMSRPHMRFVSVKSVEQQDIQATHRVREELKAHRNAKANQIRGLVAEYGLVAPKTLLALRRAIPDWLEDAENGLTDNFRSLLHGLWNDLHTLDDRLKGLDKEIEKLARSNEVTQRLQQLRGVGPPREWLSTTSTNKRLGADARITHYGPASTYADSRGRIYVRSRAMLAFNNSLAMGRSPYTAIQLVAMPSNEWP